MITGLSLYQREILRKNRKTNPVSQLEQVGGDRPCIELRSLRLVGDSSFLAVSVEKLCWFGMCMFETISD